MTTEILAGFSLGFGLELVESIAHSLNETEHHPASMTSSTHKRQWYRRTHPGR